MTVLLPPEEFVAGLPKHIASASVLITDTSNRILMLHQHNAYPGQPAWWQLPGGLCDSGESPHRTAAREAEEETGLRLGGPLPLLAVDYRPAPMPGWPPVIDFCFDGGLMAQGMTITISAEHESYDWRSFDAWQEQLQPEQLPWFASVWKARATRGSVFLVDGHEPGTE